MSWWRREVRAQGHQYGSGNAQSNYFGPVTQNVGVGGQDWDGEPKAWLAYLEQVRRIAPPDPPGLMGREAELAELARFCVAGGSSGYAWWQAGPWAGKSALLSTFVLRPPPEVAGRLRIVSFFITARLAAQDTRESFTHVLLEQLAGLTGERLPPALPEATREAFLLSLLSRAAGQCEQAGKRLVLVVDGLDEDRGVTAGPDAHSIAGLLPARPPHGMRVIVAGRPNPPVPDDVPDWHPLRDPGIIRPLPPSAYARDVKRLSSTELRRLLHGSQAGQDVLGLLAAARGGLSARDLRDLSGIPLWEVERVLHAAAGRTFARRAPAAGPETYLLGHEELQAAAAAYLGSGRLAGYRDRLHAWADACRAQGWPSGTPEYLLSGYYRLLDDTGDVPRMTRCARDAARHDRMLDITGGDAAALAEIRTALDRITAGDTPDLGGALAVAFHRDLLANRNRAVPAWLPGVWAALGHLPRAEALAASVTDPVTRARALAGIAQPLAGAGQYEHAAVVIGQAEAAARSITSPAEQAEALAVAAGALSRTGQRERAAAIVRQAEAAAKSVTPSDRQARTLARIAEALGRAGLPGQAFTITMEAEAAARPVTSPEQQPWTLECIARALAWSGQLKQAEAAARRITSQVPRARALAGLAEALAEAGQAAHAMAIAAQAQATAQVAGYSGEDTVAGIVRVLARAGQLEQAEAAARDTTSIWGKARGLASVAEALAAAGQHQRATATAAQAEATARTNAYDNDYPWALARVAQALAQAGQREQAAATATRAEAAARGVTQHEGQARALAKAAGAHAWAGQVEQAEAITRTITVPADQARALAEITEALAAAGQHERAAATAERAEATAHGISDPCSQARALAGTARALARAQLAERAAAAAERAAAAARAVTDPDRQARALAEAAGALAWAGQHDRAETTVQAITNLDLQADALAEIAGALAWVGQAERAQATARSIAGLQSTGTTRSPDSPHPQAYALAQVAEALAISGDTRNGSQLAAAACITGDWTTALRPILLLAPSTVTLAISQVETW